jgi:hypothetical protein
MKRYLFILLIFLLVLVSCACEATGSPSELAMSQAVDAQQSHYQKVQPIPWFDYSLERYLVIQLYKSRNNAVQTYSIEWNDYLGVITFQCASIGYPIPGGTELDNPWQMQVNPNYHDSAVAIGQAEPNGTFPASTSAGTYVMCLNDDGTIGPVYMEPSIQSFPYPMMEQDHRLVRVPGSGSSISIPFSLEAIQKEAELDKASLEGQVATTPMPTAVP